MINKNTEQISAAGGEWSIELLRGVAALMVVFAHYWSIAGIQPGIFIYLFSGVDLFFVISGFVFAPYLFGKNFSAGSFFLRRLFRIYPLYIISLLVYMALKIADGQEASHFLSHLLFLHTTESREVAFYYNPAYWSLPPEVEFYIFFPALILIAKLKRGFTLAVVSAFVLHCFLAFSSPLDINVVSLPDCFKRTFAWITYRIFVGCYCVADIRHWTSQSYPVPGFFFGCSHLDWISLPFLFLLPTGWR